MLKVGLKYAVICSVFLVVIFHVSSFFGINPLMNLVHLVFDLMMFGLFIFFASKELKMSQQNEVLHFWQGMTVGFNVYFFSTLVFGIYLYIYFGLNENVLLDYKESAHQFLQEKKEIYIEEMGQESFDSQLNGINEVSNMDLITSAVLKKILAGFFITPVISIILRKQPK
ncbi:MAG: DUF4199 domain-containing protein [Cyclobacteriaceae bacterium]